MHGFELSMYLIETNMSESIEFKINHVHDWNEYVWIHWVWMVLKGKGFLILEIKGRTLSIVIEYGGVSKKGCLWVPQAFLFLVQKARLGAPHFETIPYAGFGILNQLGSKLLENLSFQRVKGTCREKLCGSPPCPAWWPGALLLWSQLHTHRKSSPRHPTLQVKVCALLSDWDVPFWFCNEIGETPKSKTFSAKPQSRSAWPWSGLRNLAGLRSTTISASSKAPSLEPTGSIWTGEDGWLSGPCLLRLSLWWDQAPPWCGPHPSATCSASHLFGEILWSPSSTDPRLTSLCCAHLALIGHPWRSKSEGPSATCWGAAAPPPLKDNIILMNPVSTASRFKRTLTLTAHVTMKFHVQKNTHWQDMPLQNFSQVLQTKLEPFEPSCTNWNKPSLVQGSEKGFELLLSLRGCRVQITGQQHSEQNALDLREALHNVDAQGFDFHFLSSEPRHLEQILNQQAWVNLLACDGLKQHSVLGSLGPCRKMSFDLKSSFKAALWLELIHPQVHEPSRRQRTPSVPRLSASLQGSATHRSEGSALTASWQVSTWFRS